MLLFLDILLFIVHIVVITFNLTGWIWKRTRRLHLWVVLLTWISWLGFGLFYGFGYCFLTDWHWDIKRKLGETHLPNSFIQYLFEQFGFSIQPSMTDTITLIAFLFATVMCLYFSFFKKS